MEGSGRRQFNVVSCLGRGGFGEVYRAAMSSAGGIEAEVALKVLRRDLDPRGQAVQRLRDEGRLLARLNHPTILRVHDLVILEGRISLITEFVDGQDLGVLFRSEPTLSARALVEIIGQVASALDAAWNAPLGDGSEGKLRLVHRDIKPSNIRISRHGEVKLLDFGIARADSVQREARTQTDLMVGSPAYMAPERFLDNTIHPASDVFSLGASLFEGLAGHRLYNDMPVPMIATLAIDGKRYVELVEKQLASLQGVPEPLLDLLRETVLYDPTERIDAADLAARCEALADELPGPSLGRYCRERKWPDADRETGELEGRTLTEGTMARTLVDTAPTAERPRNLRRRVAAYVAMGAALAGLILVVIMFGVAGGITLGLGWLPGAQDDVAIAPVPTPEQPSLVEPEEPILEKPADPEPEAPVDPRPGDGEVETLPVPAPSAGPSPVTPGEGAQPQPEPRESSPGEADAPRPVAPAPRPTPAPQPASAATGKVISIGDADAELDVNGTRIPLTADVPPGTWPIYARFHGRAPARSGNITVRAGEEVHVSCISRMYRCDVH